MQRLIITQLCIAPLSRSHSHFKSPAGCRYHGGSKTQSRIESLGNLGQQRNTIDTDVNAISAETTLRLRQLRWWSGTLDELEQLAVPDEETIERFENGFNDLDMQHIALQDRQREIDETRRSLAEQLGRLEARRDIPTLDSLVAAREDRERLANCAEGFTAFSAEFRRSRKICRMLSAGTRPLRGLRS